MNKLKRWALIVPSIALVGCSLSGKIIEQKTTSRELSELEQEVHQLINQYRISKNLPPLTAHGMISQQARIHSRAMAQKRVMFGHDGFAKRVQRISRFLSYRVAAENVAYIRGYSDCAHNVVQGWLSNTSHRKTIAGNYKLTGIGVAKGPRGGYYLTQIFWRQNVRSSCH